MNNRYMLLTLVCTTVACSDFHTPAELSKPQIIALRVEPATITPGSRAKLTALVAGPDGIMPAEVSWSVTSPANAANATIDVDDEGTWIAPALDAIPASIEVDARVVVAGDVLLGVRSVRIARDVTDNPRVATLRVNGDDLPEGQPLVLQRSEPVELTISTAPHMEDGARVSWYATVGEITLYRRVPTEFVAPDQPATGWLIVVYRDGVGGVAWRSHPLQIQP